MIHIVNLSTRILLYRTNVFFFFFVCSFVCVCFSNRIHSLFSIKKKAKSDVNKMMKEDRIKTKHNSLIEFIF